MTVGDRWLHVWAKSVRDENGRPTHWLPLYQHLDDTAGVAGFLVDEWVSPQVVARIAEDVPEGRDAVRRLVTWLAGVHDVGKASPAFAVQVECLADHLGRNGLPVSPLLAHDPERRTVSHALVGHRVVRDWLTDELDFDRLVAATQLATVVGGHHGVPPESSQLSHVGKRPDLAGVGPWQEIRQFLLTRANARVGGIEFCRNVRLGRPNQALLTAIVIVADWIASNHELFPLRPLETLDEPAVPPDDDVTERRVKEGMAALALPPQWNAHRLGADLDDVFRRRFGRSDGSVRPVQAAAVEVVRAEPTPGMVVIEAPMGAGKTEAAFLAAEELAHRSGADGCFVALPTQATSDAMFDRFLRWVSALPGHPDDAAVAVTLAHGKASLNDTFRGLVRKGRFHGIGGDDGDQLGPLIAHQWLGGRKKGPLASFVVGTVDQVLFAGLKSRHVMLRHLALAGKVVIIDEVHAYDVYMSQYLYRVLHWLGAYRVPVVLLSATLPAGKRAELLYAYRGGGGDVPAADLEAGYPVVMSSGLAAPRVVDLPPGPGPVRIDRLADDLDELVEYLSAHLAQGGCAAVVRNTVGRVQETADRLIDEFGEDHVTVDHARFLSCDRAQVDRELVRRFGPPENNAGRPPLHIVVASQVVEQSLDVDFDLMVTDLAPIDLVLQRMGRLHRHRRTRPGPVDLPRCAVTGVGDWTASPVPAVAGSRRVYGEHTLLRAAALLAERDTIDLPADISPLVQRAYGPDRLGPADWQATMDEAAKTAEDQARARITRAQDFLLGPVGPDTGSLVGWVRAGVGDAEDNPKAVAQVRDGNDALEVLVVQRDADGGLLTPAWIGRDAGRQLPTDQEMPPGLARVVAACALRLPPALCHPGVLDDVITALEHNAFASFHQSPLLTGHLVLVLGLDRSAVVRHGTANFRLSYDPRRGLRHERL